MTVLKIVLSNCDEKGFNIGFDLNEIISFWFFYGLIGSSQSHFHGSYLERPGVRLNFSMNIVLFIDQKTLSGNKNIRHNPPKQTHLLMHLLSTLKGPYHQKLSSML